MKTETDSEMRARWNREFMERQLGQDAEVSVKPGMFLAAVLIVFAMVSLLLWVLVLLDLGMWILGK